VEVEVAQQDGGLEVAGLSKDYVTNNVRHRVVDDLSFTIEPGTFYSLLGPSGCGKTTTLRCVAGLEHADGGEIRIGGTVVSRDGVHISPDRRDLGMVFQNYAIWPHLTVFENVAFPLRVTDERIGKAEIKRRVAEALDLVRLSDFAARPAVAMSGGQQQRLAVARALVRQPRLLLLDEPLSNLDAKLRDEMRVELRSLQRRLGITTLYVTHDQGEALSMSDRVAVMSGGRIVQEGTPREIYHEPRSRFVADFVGRANLVTATVVEHLADGEMMVNALGGVVRASCRGIGAPGDTVTLSVRPENLRSHPSRPDAPNVFAGEIVSIEFLGEIMECRVRVHDSMLSVRQNPLTPATIGDRVFVEITPQSCVVLAEAAAALV
jgi:iron(III) transport system ATP-binding protein